MNCDQNIVQRMLDARQLHWPESISLHTEFMISTIRLSELIIRQATIAAETCGITFTEFEVLAALRSFGPDYELIPQELCHALLVSSGGLSKVLRNLEAKKLVRRRDSPIDGRSKPVRLTNHGKEMAEKVMSLLLDPEKSLISKPMPQATIFAMVRHLKMLLPRMEKTEMNKKGK